MFRTAIFALRQATFAIALAVILTAIIATSAQAQTFHKLYDFGAYPDPVGFKPFAALGIDSLGDLYGTNGASHEGYGTVFKVTRRDSGWTLQALYTFRDGYDGAIPLGSVTLGPDGSLYGTTRFGGGKGDCYYDFGCGTVFKLTPPTRPCHAALCDWTKTTLWQFAGIPDGADPQGNVVLDEAGKIYGTTFQGGTLHANTGTVYQLSPSQSGWSEQIIHSFLDGFPNDAAQPVSGPVFDRLGNLYGTTIGGGTDGRGAVYKLTRSGSSWSERILYSFRAEEDGWYPMGGPMFDRAGNLFGATSWGGTNSGGAVFELTRLSTLNWTFNLLYDLPEAGYGPTDRLIMDATGNLYGTTAQGGAYGYGTVFKLTPTVGGWTYSLLHEFSGIDGNTPFGGVTMDAAGNLYGTTYYGGTYEGGVLFEITP